MRVSSQVKAGSVSLTLTALRLATINHLQQRPDCAYMHMQNHLLCPLNKAHPVCTFTHK